MAQTQTVTDEGIAELIKLLCGETATEVEAVCGLTDSTPCTAAVGSTYATPADPKATTAGIAQQNADSVVSSQTNVVDDTIEVDHVFTATGSINMSGVITTNNDDDVNIMEVCFNAVLALESTDTVTFEGKIVLDQA